MPDGNRAAQELLARYAAGIRAFQEAVLGRASLRNAVLVGANLAFANLSEAELDDANLSEADLSDANLTLASLSGANLSKADLRNVKLTFADLSGAYLIGADLRRADLSDANLSGTNLREADLREANLNCADLRNADLRNANLCDLDLNSADLSRANLSAASLAGANLNSANLSRADLSGADLTGADLSGADLSGADLTGTNLSDSAFGATILGDLDLSSVRTDTLIDVRHHRRSTIGTDTLMRSKGEIPREFLRGCGLAEWELEMAKLYDPRLTLAEASEIQLRAWEKRFAGPIQYNSCFISYSHLDEEFARNLHGRLQAHGLRVWYAPEDIKSGKKLHHQIDDAIRLHDKLLLVLSEASMRSEWVATEISHARKREKAEGKQVLFPIALIEFDAIREWECFDADVGKDSAREIREYFIPDFSNWRDEHVFEQAAAKLIKDLRAETLPATS